MPMTSHTTCSAGSLRRRTDAGPVAANASAIHGGEESGVEVRPVCVCGLPQSAGISSAGSPEPVVGR